MTNVTQNNITINHKGKETPVFINDGKDKEQTIKFIKGILSLSEISKFDATQRNQASDNLIEMIALDGVDKNAVLGKYTAFQLAAAYTTSHVICAMRYNPETIVEPETGVKTLQAIIDLCPLNAAHSRVVNINEFCNIQGLLIGDARIYMPSIYSDIKFHSDYIHHTEMHLQSGLKGLLEDRRNRLAFENIYQINTVFKQALDEVTKKELIKADCKNILTRFKNSISDAIFVKMEEKKEIPSFCKLIDFDASKVSIREKKSACADFASGIWNLIIPTTEWSAVKLVLKEPNQFFLLGQKLLMNYAYTPI